MCLLFLIALAAGIFPAKVGVALWILAGAPLGGPFGPFVPLGHCERYREVCVLSHISVGHGFAVPPHAVVLIVHIGRRGPHCLIAHHPPRRGGREPIGLGNFVFGGEVDIPTKLVFELPSEDDVPM